MKTSEVIAHYRAGRIHVTEAVDMLVDQGYTPADAYELLHNHGRVPTNTGLYVLGGLFIIGLWAWLYFGPLNY